MSMKRKNFHSSGQALILVLLSLSVVLTIVLYALSRSVTDIATSSGQAESVRAFSAAEAGVENALITGAGTNGMVSIGNASYSVEVKDSSLAYFNYPIQMMSGDIMTLWFISRKEDGSLTCQSGYPDCFTGNTVRVCWGKEGTPAGGSSTPAVEVSVYYETVPGDFSTARIARAVYDPNSSRTASNNFSSASLSGCTIDNTNYDFQTTLSMPALGVNSSGLLFAKVRMLYNNLEPHMVGFDVPSGTLPPQGLEINSVGISGEGGSQSSRRISFFQGWPEFPLSNLSVFTPVGIVK